MLREKFDIVKYINEKVENNIKEKNLIENNEKIVVAVSGGPDSMCLLTVLNELKPLFLNKYNISYELVVAHVNHMIRKESEQEKVYVEEYCKKLKIPFFYLKKDIPNLSENLKLSEETCARNVRYEFFYEVMKKTNSSKIAVAHNLDDDCETILLNIIRGTGLNGLTGMNFINKSIIRPLLNIEKKSILEYNKICDLKPCFDKTNFENVYARNKIRNLLIPNLKNEYNSNIVENIIRMKNILSMDEDFLNNYTLKVVKNSIIENNNCNLIFNFSNILEEHESIKYRAIRMLIEENIGNLNGISNIHIKDILLLLENNIKGKKYIIGNKFEIEIVKRNFARITIKGGKNEEKLDY